MEGAARVVGRELRRKEDPRLLTGDGLYVGDVTLPRMLHASIVRSTVPSGVLRRVDLSVAGRLPGVVAAIGAVDLPESGPTIAIRLASRDSMLPFRQRCLATDVLRYVGEPVAVVVAESPYAAEDAANAVRVEADRLDTVTTVEAALQPGAPLVHIAAGTNVMASAELRRGDYEAARSAAHVVVAETLAIQRHFASPMEPRGLAADYDRARSLLTVWGSVKVPHYNRRALAQMLGLPEERIRFVQTDAGGSFGARGEFYPEDFLIPYLALKLQRPVKWIEDRREHFVSANHSRQQVHRVEVALAQDGSILGLKDTFLCDMGAYARTTGSIVSDVTMAHLTGPYRIPAFQIGGCCVATHKTPAGTYRGPGHYEGTFVRERILDLCSRRLGIDPAELRRRNLVTPSEQPYDAGAGSAEAATIFEDCDFPGLFDQTLQRADYGRWRRRRGETPAGDGRRIGVGVAMSVGKSGIGPWEYARVRIEPSGRVTVFSGGSSVGQGVETVLAQICADALGVDYGDVTTVEGDSDQVPLGIGSFASRTTVVGGMAVREAALALRRRVVALAAARLEVSPEDLEVVGREVRVRGAPARRIELSALVQAAAPGRPLADPSRPVLEESAVWSTSEQVPCPAAVHVAVVQVDTATMAVDVLRYVVGYDIGRAINPRLVRGQIAGGVAGGIGGAMLEDLRYDASGQLLCGTFMDYLLPTACEVPQTDIFLSEATPSRLNALGAKGADGGIACPAGALSNAIDDALSGLGCDCLRLPLDPNGLFASMPLA